MTSKHWAVALVSVLLVPLLAAAALWWGVNAQLADSRWLDPSVLNDAPVAEQSEQTEALEMSDNEFGDFAFPDATAEEASGGGGTLLVDTIREQVAGRLVEAVGLAALATVIAGIIWVIFVATRLPTVVGTSSARSLLWPWVAVMLGQILVVVFIAYLATASDDVTPYLIQTGKFWFSTLLVLVLTFAWWLASLLATPHRLRPSVPGGNNVPFGVE